MSWKSPGRSGSLVYAVAALLLGAVVTVMTRMTLARRRGSRTQAARLPEGPVIIISNHASHIDGVLLAITCRRLGRSVRLLATAGVFRAPGLGWLARRVGFISVERGSVAAADALAIAAEALQAGEAVGIFPEGRTTRDPHHWPERAKTGTVRLALSTGAPIVPVAMVGTQRVLTRKHPLRWLVANLVLRPKVLIDVGEPIDVRALAGLDGPGPQPEPDPDEVRALADQVMAELIALVATLRGEPAPHPTGVDRA